MAHKAPGKHYRAGLTLIELTRMFPDDAVAEHWFVKTSLAGRSWTARADGSRLNSDVRNCVDAVAGVAFRWRFFSPQGWPSVEHVTHMPNGQNTDSRTAPCAIYLRMKATQAVRPA